MGTNKKTENESLADVGIEIPKEYRVVMLNDNFTTVDFVVQVLQIIFKKTLQQSEKIAQEIHEKGASIVGVYPYSIAQEKIYETHSLAQKYGHPLKCKLERED